MTIQQKQISSAQLTETLRQRITSGQWLPGQRVDTEKALAQEFGTSKATVQRSMQELEALGFIYGKRGSGRFVREDAPRDRTYSITLLIAEPRHMFHPAMVEIGKGVSHITEQRKYHFHYSAMNQAAGPDDAARSEFDWKGFLRTERTDGVIIATQKIAPDAIERISHEMPAVWLHPITQQQQLASVTIDYLGGAYQAASHLRSLGHKRITLLTHPALDRIARAQFDGARLAYLDLLRSGEGNLNLIAVNDDEVKFGREAGQQWLELPAEKRGTAVLAGSDELALGFYQTITKAGVRVPDDISLVGWNDFITREEIPIDLTTVRVRWQDAGRRSAEKLLNIIESSGTHHKDEIVDCDLIVRQSTVALKK